MTLTPTLRKYDAGVLVAGAVNGLAIPPKMKHFTSSSFCTSQCSRQVCLHFTNYDVSRSSWLNIRICKYAHVCIYVQYM